ncbi:MAG: hypothetical protein ACAF41_14180 [Leptolyngbya sp. BL-A-14]
MGIAKYLSRTGQTATCTQLLEKLGIGDLPLKLGIQSLEHLGFRLRYLDNAFHITWEDQPSRLGSDTTLAMLVESFTIAVKEEQFRRQYFYQVPLETIQAIASSTAL